MLLHKSVIGLVSHAKRDYGASAMTLGAELLPTRYTSYRWRYFFNSNHEHYHF